MAIAKTGQQGLKDLIKRLTCFKVLVWGDSSSNPDLTTDREVANVMDAHVVSSLLRDPGASDEKPRHKVVIDIDHPTYLVKSSTPGHYHLYIDVPGGIDETDYFILLNALSQAGVIEEGYRQASVSRGHSDVRLPWVKKGMET